VGRGEEEGGGGIWGKIREKERVRERRGAKEGGKRKDEDIRRSISNFIIEFYF
jgi:hypothetical protein